MGVIKFTSAEVEKVLDGRYNSFRQAILDATYTSGSPLALSASTETLLTNDAAGFNVVTAPTYIASRWSVANSKLAVPDELDNPTYVNDLQFTFDPTVASAGTVTIRVYIDESGTRNFGTDPLIRTYSVDYKAIAEVVSVISTWYMGDDVGFDAKNNGVYFTVEASGAGDLYGTFFSLYRT